MSSQIYDDQHVIFADPTKCKACKKCELACIAAHNGMTVKEAIKVRKNFSPRLNVVKTDNVKMPVMCRQCEDSPCAKACPTGALVLAENGRSHLREQLCAGCGLCVMACPYGAMYKEFKPMKEEEKYSLESNQLKMVAVRCDTCAQWRSCESKSISACVEACPFGALRLVTHDEFKRLEKLEEEGQPLPVAAHLKDKSASA